MKSQILALAMIIGSVSTVGCGETSFKGTPQGAAWNSAKDNDPTAADENGNEANLSLASDDTQLGTCPSRAPMFRDAMYVEGATLLSDSEILEDIEAAVRNNITLATSIVQRYQDSNGCQRLVELTRGILSLNQDLLEKLLNESAFRQFTIQIAKARSKLPPPPAN